MKHPLLDLHSNRPAEPDLTRPARIVARVVLTEGRQGLPATYAVEAMCDDGKIRRFEIGRDGALRRVGQ